jgi:hypothetical protein
MQPENDIRCGRQFPLTLSAWVFVAHFAYLLAIQVQTAMLFGPQGLASIAFMQAQTFVASLAVAAICLVTCRRRAASVAFLPLFGLLLCVYATNVVYVRLVRQPFALGATDGIAFGDLGPYWGSFVATLGPLQYANYAAALAITGLLLWFALGHSVRSSPRPTFVAAALAGLFVICTAPVLMGSPDTRVAALARHPLLGFVPSHRAEANDALPIPVHTLPPQQFYALLHGAPHVDRVEQALLARNLEILRKRKRNVVFVVLESIGPRQLLQDGVPRAAIAPFLHSQAGNALVFEDLPVVFPGSARSNVALATGGRTVTWGSVYAETLYPFDGQTTFSAYRDAGWKTALFAAVGLDFENLNIFFANLGLEKMFNPDALPDDVREKYRTSSWGIDERIVVDEAVTWSANHKPFLLTLLTSTTHHPYTIPADYAAPFAGDDDFDLYRNAVHFTDSALARMVEGLKQAGLAQDTLLFIVGDHGEAFGEPHRDNFLHNNQLYQENIGGFLMLIDLSGEIEPARIRLRGAQGDVMPTLLDVQNLPIDSGVLGQSLLSPRYEERIAFFHKNSDPEKWGLRDGHWKFIVEKVDSKNAELYDLDADPDEQVNLASRYPARVGEYVNRLSNWYIHTNDAFVSQLRGYDYKGSPGLTIANLDKPGPKRIAIGSKRDHLPFEPLDGDVNPDEEVVVWTNGPPYPQTRSIEYRFTAPSGGRESIFIGYDREWSTSWMREKRETPREEGEWLVELYDGDVGIIETRFSVSSRAPLRWSAIDKRPGLRDIHVGVKPAGDDFHAVNVLNPRESAAVIVHGVPFENDRLLEYLWIAPDDSYSAYTFMQKAGWDAAWTFRPPEAAMAPGKWRVEVWLDSEFLLGKDFEVLEQAPLFIPAFPLEAH